MRVAIIPARGGSQRIPRKNIKDFMGKPIIAYAIDTAKKSGVFDSIWVSTEDREIAEVANRYGAAHIPRPDELAEVGDAPDPGTQEITRHALGWLLRGNIKPDYACCIYPCTPLMTAETLKRGLDICEVYGATFAYVRGWFYWGSTEAFLKHWPLTEGAEMSPPGIHVDINTPEDWAEAERVYRGRHIVGAA